MQLDPPQPHFLALTVKYTRYRTAIPYCKHVPAVLPSDVTLGAGFEGMELVSGSPSEGGTDVSTHQT